MSFSGGARPWRRRARAGVLFLAVWAALIGVLVMLERHFIYFPYRELEASPAEHGLEAEELSLTAADGTKLHGWWIRGAQGAHGASARELSGESGPERPAQSGLGGEPEPRQRSALVWYHGNAGNISHRLDNARLLVQRFGIDILLADYRGYGRSEGTPDEAGLYQDGFAMYAEARRRLPPDRLILFGRSLGAAVAVEVAIHARAAGVILETPFRSIPAMAREIYPFVPPWLIRTRFDVESKIARLTAPVLILHGDRDDIVPIAHARRLYELAPQPKRLYVIPGALHNDTYLVGGAKYLAAWEEFLRETVP